MQMLEENTELSQWTLSEPLSFYRVLGNLYDQMSPTQKLRMKSAHVKFENYVWELEIEINPIEFVYEIMRYWECVCGGEANLEAMKWLSTFTRWQGAIVGKLT